tara:strand:+ start:20602 stop:21372 length:771 start_codon:yes stop_codon:yes gene_type:complete
MKAIKEKDQVIITGLVMLLAILWIGFAFHRSPRFAGSFWGGMLAVVGSFFMLIPLFYSFIKRIKFLKKWITPVMPMRTLLAWHIYAGVIGPILVLLHTGHKFESVLGISLTAMTLIVVFSGFVGRYLLTMISKEMREKKQQLEKLLLKYEETAFEIQNDPQASAAVKPFAGFFKRIFSGLFVEDALAISPAASPAYRALKLSEAIADLEYAIATHETFKKAFKRWLKLHIAISMVLYVLMALHVWASIHFGIRWFS